VKNIEGREYIFFEYTDFSPGRPDEPPGYFVFKRAKPRQLFSGDNVINKDLRNYDLSDITTEIRSIVFNEKTKFPTDLKRLPQLYPYQPHYVMERGKNPGLGVRDLHSQGITGKGVNIAIIDEPLFLDHPEYKGKIVEYKDFTGQENENNEDVSGSSSLQGPAIASLLAGNNTGTAPGVNIYYAAVPPWSSFDAGYYAKALDWIIEVNQSLPQTEKIRAVCLPVNPRNPLPWINVDVYLHSFQRAYEEGLLILDCSKEHGIIIGACRYDFDNPDDVSLCRPVSAYRIFISGYHYNTVEDLFNEDYEDTESIRAPAVYRTMAEAYGEGDGEFAYQYYGQTELSWAIPYVTGVLAMGWQINPALTHEEISKILFVTAHTDDRGNKYINPVNFVDYIKNN